MQNSLPDAPVGANHEVIRGLREVADFLEAHPDLPGVRAVAWIPEYRRPDEHRAELSALAAALGERAAETIEFGLVTIAGQFGAVRLHAQAKPEELGETPPPPTPRYEPIIKPCPSCNGEGGRTGYSPQGLPDPQTEELCDRCEGSGREIPEAPR